MPTQDSERESTPLIRMASSFMPHDNRRERETEKERERERDVDPLPTFLQHEGSFAIQLKFPHHV